MEYVEFTSYNNGILKNEFLQELRNNNDIIHFKNLADIISEKKNQIKVNFNKCKYENVYMVIISCHIDSILIKLGRSFNFPRGFPIMWIPGKMIKLFGFYPKFDNDNRQSPDEESEFDDINKIEFFKKWSGFLGQVCIFKLDEKLCWTCCSKNSANHDSEYVQDCKRLFEKFLNPVNLNKLYSNNYHLCAEMMSFNDQKHGARVLKETPVITSLAQGCLVHLDGSKPNIITNNMVDFIPHQPLVEFCRENNLPCDSAIIISNGNAIEFMKNLSEGRDFMTNTRLNDLISKNSDKVTLIEGTVKHQEILGDVLEGLVVKATKQNGQNFTKKYKFPNYTVRTMAIREFIKKFTPLGLVNPILNDNEFINYCERWCITELGKEFWYKFLCSVAIILKKGTHPVFVPYQEVGLHIQICDFITTEILNNKLPPEINLNFFDDLMYMYKKELSDSIKSTIIITVGPIGSGKSSTSEKISREFSGLTHHIDGDKLDLGIMEEVLNLKGERNDYTIWQIIKHLMLGQIPIISTGGGALFSFGKNPEFVLKQRIMEILGIDVKIILLIPTSNVDNFELYNSDIHDIESIYQKNQGDITKAIVGRVLRGEWQMPDNFYPNPKKTKKSLEEMKKDEAFIITAAENFSRKIIKSSEKNLVFTRMLMEIANDIIMYPKYNPDNYLDSDAIELNYEIIAEKLTIPKDDIPELGNFQQDRILVKKPDQIYHHITIQYDNDRNIKKSIAEFERINSILEAKNIYSGTNIKLSPENKKYKDVEFIIVDGIDEIVIDGGAHITVNKGSHAAAMMRPLTLAIKNRLEFIDIKSENGESVTYNLSNREENPVTVELISNFGI